MDTLVQRGVVSERLARINDVFNADVGKGAIPGAVVLIAQHGKLAYLEAFGFRDRERQLPMAMDSIFRIASMTKPMVSAAVMMLAEEGKLRLANPVSTYLPELKNLQVGVEVAGADGQAGAAARAGAARDVGAGPAAPHFRADLRAVRRFAGEAGVSRGECVRPEPDDRRVRLQAVASCRCRTSRARCGITACRPMCSGAWSRWSRGWNSTRLSKRASPGRWA